MATQETPRSSREIKTTTPNAMSTTPSKEQAQPIRTFAPPVDIYENDKEMLVYADLPGVAKDAVQIQLEPERLTLLAVRTIGDDTVNYRRVFTVAPVFDTEKVSAKLEKGVLTLKLPKSPKVMPRQIPVNAG